MFGKTLSLCSAYLSENQRHSACNEILQELSTHVRVAFFLIQNCIVVGYFTYTSPVLLSFYLNYLCLFPSALRQYQEK